MLDRSGNRITRPDETGRIRLPVLRPVGAPTPCHQCPKIPDNVDKVRANAIELSEKNSAAYGHYLRCRAVNRFPDDALVELHAAVIRSVYDQYEQLEKLSILVGLRGALNGRSQS